MPGTPGANASRPRANLTAISGSQDYIARSQVQAWSYITREQIGVVKATLCMPHPLEGVDFDELPIGEFEKALALHSAPLFLLFTALYQVVKALKRLEDLPASIRELHDEDLYQRVKAHRDVFEHWEEHQLALSLRPMKPLRRAGERFRKRFPDGIPDAIAYDRDSGEFTLGPNAGTISLAEIEALLDRIDKETGLGPPT